MPFGRDKPLIIRFEKELTDQEIDQAFAISSNTTWYRAIVQLIKTFSDEYSRHAQGCAERNSSLEMASDVGAMQALQGLLVELETRRAKNAD